ncbi:MAG: copper-binding protein [Proteobacteria bacterium]|nr:copper-binding protein [Burkholderiales bacterium]
MNSIRTRIAAISIATIALASAAPMIAFGQGASTHSAAETRTAAPAPVDGEIRRVDKAGARLTIRHGEIKHMDMPPMTMVFHVKDKAVLETVREGEKVRFMVVNEGGKLFALDVQPAR